MIILRESVIHELKNLHGQANMLPCYAEARGLSVITEQAVLLLSSEKLTILFISKISNQLIQKVEFNFSEITNSTLKESLFAAATWQFNARGQRWKFRIPTVLPLRKMRHNFIEGLYSYQYI
ncbi:hypothetical protein [Enterococcus sp. HY326]|uniref:hypothetical protein n=1 Tax=Enterococcus sp. HY326 TaxID=2971265 RepID=UPI0022405911|nr:hypothetical protein [Enterococcus sp. HY326]